MTTRPTGVVTFLFTDIEGSTSLWAREPEAMREALEQHDAVLRSGIQQASGHVFSTAGDSFSATFQQPSEAVAAAIALQQSLLATTWAGGLDVRIRMGLHLGVADERDGNYFGSAVNLAARVSAAAHGGQILISDALAQHVRGYELLDLGEHRLRGFDQPHRLLQVQVPGPVVEFPPVRTQSPAVRLPAVRTFLIGREEAVREIRGLLAAHRLVTLTGTGGVGKTSLAVEIASREATRGDRSVVFIDLSALAVGADILPTAAAAFGLSSDDPSLLRRQLVEVIGDRQTVVVLDNCEQVIDSVAGVVDDLMASCAEVKILATSRQLLSVPGEHAWRVPSLALAEAAVPLFEQRAAESDARIDFGQGGRRMVLDICRRLDGIPLAIELAASRVRTLSLDEILHGLDRRFRLLTTTRRGIMPRQQTLENVIAWSYDLLSPDEQRTLRCLGVFSGGFLLKDAAAVLGIDEFDAIDTIDSLVSKSIVETIRPTGSRSVTRYRLFESVCSFALDRLVAAGEVQSARVRHLDHFLDTDSAPPDLDVATVNSRVHIRDFTNLRAAANFALESGRAPDATRLTLGRAVPIAQHGAAAEGLAWLGGRNELEVNDHMWALNGCAFLAMAMGDRDQAKEFSHETFALAGATAFDALPNAYVFAAMNALFDADSEALTMAEQALDVMPRTPSGVAHIPAAHHCRSLVLAHHRLWPASLDDAEIVLHAAEPRSPYRGEAQALRLAALSALQRTDLFLTALHEIARPAPIRAQEWGLRLFDMIERGGAGRRDLGGLAGDALAMAGGDPVQRCRDLLAALLWVQSPAVAVLAGSDSVSAALSTSCFGALAAVAVGRARDWADEVWFDERSRIGRSDGYAQRKATALRAVADLADP